MNEPAMPSGLFDPPDPIVALILRLAALSQGDDLPPAGTPLGDSTREFLANNWVEARDGLLSRTRKLRVSPVDGSCPSFFCFEVDRPYKRKRSTGAPVELVQGPLRGSIKYRPDVLVADPGEPAIAVLLDPAQALFHPNFSRRHGVLCVGGLPGGPFPLEALLEHLYGILTYQNRNVESPADLEAALYFAADPAAMEGLEPVEPLY